jgi:hypothetical protein
MGPRFRGDDKNFTVPLSAPAFLIRRHMVLHKTQELQTWPSPFKS